MANKVLKVIVEHPSGSRKSFTYNVKDEKEAKEIIKWVKQELKNNLPASFVADYRINEVK